MPKVTTKGGTKAFPYTKAGEKDAASYAKKTGGKETMAPPKVGKKK